MKDVKEIVAQNLTDLRVAKGMTQLELAEKLNYSDKAVSKWERGESLPGLSTIVEIARLFQVSLDDLIQENCVARIQAEGSVNAEINAEHTRRKVRNHALITAMGIVTVWFAALLVYVLAEAFHGKAEIYWLAFAYAVPTSALVWLIFNAVWFNPKRNFLIISVLMWSTLASLHVTILTIGINFWMLYLLGVPAQVAIILWSNLHYKKKP